MVKISTSLHLDCLDVGHFRAQNCQPNRNNSVYGGQLLAQCIDAAEAFMGNSGRKVHAIHAFFERPAAATAAVDYRTSLSFNGRNETFCQVRAEQSKQAILSSTVAFGTTRPGFSHQACWSVAPTAPERACRLGDVAMDLASELSAHGATRTRTYPQVEVRPLIPREHLLVTPGPARSLFWIRAVGKMDDWRISNSALLAYLSDYLTVNAALVPHVSDLPKQPLFVATLNHAMWFHGESEPTDWLFFDFISPWAGNARALCTGRIFDRKGRLLASVSQEMLISARRSA